jgi:regulation of enolase protein 1 (concanavalin A-like superfamily)
LTLINADTDQPITASLSNGAVLDFAALPTRNLSIRANTTPAAVGSVRFAYDGNANFKIENSAPYAIAGDQNGTDYLPWTPTLGAHTLTATPYTAADLGGVAGTPLTINFTVQDSSGGGGGSGLSAQYFDNSNFTALKTTRTDATVDFNWAQSAPVGAGLTNPDTFSVRWSGFVQPQYSETYTFYTTSDDGVRLWVNGQQIINNWTIHGATENSGSIALSAGQKYDLRLEFYENAGDAVARLAWSSNSQAKQVIPQARLFPAAFTNLDVGSVGVAGSAAANAGLYTLIGSGADIWNTADAFHFAYRPLSGNGEIVARVTAVGNTNGWAKAGVMIRQTLAPGSKHALVALTPGNGVAFQRRTTDNGASNSTAGGAAAAPTWVRLVRSGSTFTGYRSNDGSSWTLSGSATISMTTDVYVGLAVTSHNNGVACTAKFDQVRY